MIKKIIHLSDIHVRTNQLHDLYRNQFQRFIDDIKKLRLEYDHNEIRVVITGDIFHQKITTSNEQTLLVSWFFNEITKIGKLIILPGNHDFLENNTQRVDSITPIVELIKNPHITYFKDGGEYYDENVKWIVYSLYQHNQRPEFTKEDGYTHVGLFHDPIQGMTTDIGYEFDTAYDKLNFIGCDVVLCGDVHKRQILTMDKEIIIDESQLNNYLKDGWKIC